MKSLEIKNKIKELEIKIKQITGFTPESFQLAKELAELKNIAKRDKMVKELQKDNWKELATKFAKSWKKLINVELEQEIGLEKCNYIYIRQIASQKKEKERLAWKLGNQQSFSNLVRKGVK